jgi:hypothetical protein
MLQSSLLTEPHQPPSGDCSLGAPTATARARKAKPLATPCRRWCMCVHTRAMAVEVLAVVEVNAHCVRVHARACTSHAHDHACVERQARQHLPARRLSASPTRSHRLKATHLGGWQLHTAPPTQEAHDRRSSVAECRTRFRWLALRHLARTRTHAVGCVRARLLGHPRTTAPHYNPRDHITITARVSPAPRDDKRINGRFNSLPAHNTPSITLTTVAAV